MIDCLRFNYIPETNNDMEWKNRMVSIKCKKESETESKYLSHISIIDISKCVQNAYINLVLYLLSLPITEHIYKHRCRHIRIIIVNSQMKRP